MRKAKELKQGLLAGILALVLGLGVFGAGFSTMTFVSHAETQVKITAKNGANIRQSATTSSTKVGGAQNGDVLTVISEVQDSSGVTWYQVQTANNVTGYIRSDLVEVVGGTTPPEPQAPETPTTVVTEVNPVSATVAGDGGKIFSDASTDSSVVAETVPAGTMLTVSGYADAADGRRWYKVSYIANSITVEGFIREDSVSLSEELVPPGAGDPGTPEDTQPPVAQPDYEVMNDNGVWKLADYTGSPAKTYGIKELFDGMENNQKVYEENQKTIKNQKIIIIVLVFLLVAAAAGIAFLVFKIRDMMDSAYYSEVENETLRRRSAAGNQSGQKVMHTVGTDKQQQRPTGAKPAGSGQGQRPTGTSQGQRSAGSSQSQRPTGTSQGQRPAGSSQGQRPTGTSQGQRPAGSGQGQRPSGTSQGQRPAGSSQSQRPSGTSQGQRPAGSSQGSRGQGTSQGTRTVQQGSAQRTQPKNFLEEDDEFEFEFLNYNGDDEQ